MKHGQVLNSLAMLMLCITPLVAGAQTNQAPTIDSWPTADPSLVTGTNTTLSVAASDADGDTLKYTWDKVSGPGAVIFGEENGTTTGAVCRAVFSAYGEYSLQVSVSDGTNTVTGLTPVTVVRTVTTVTVTPGVAFMGIGHYQSFGAAAGDQFGTAVSASLIWTVAAGPGGVNSEGLYTATTSGTATVRAWFDATVYGDAAVTVRAGADPSALQEFLAGSAAWADLPSVSHTPQFNLETITPPADAVGTDWRYIRDGTNRIGLVQTWIKEIEMFNFTPAGGDGGSYTIPPVYHWGNLYGARIQMYGTQLLPPVTSFELTFTQDSGTSIVFTVAETHQGDIEGTSEYRLTWDERLGYLWTCVSRYSMPTPCTIEFNNLLAGNVSDSRDARKRWQKTVRSIVDGRISHVFHSPLSIPTDDICAAGFVGYVTEDGMNPFVEFLESSTPIYIATCSVWYDQHIQMKAPVNIGDDGRYHVEARYRFLSLPAAVTREIEAVAVDIHPRTGDSGVTGFLQNRINDFEASIPYGVLYNGSIWQHTDAVGGVAHSGTQSMKVVGPGVGQVKFWWPLGGGPMTYGESDKNYRFAAWVKTEGLADGGAYLQVDDILYSTDDVLASRRSPKISYAGSPGQGDLNADSVVDDSDMAIVVASFGRTSSYPGWDPLADAHPDGVVNAEDLAVVVTAFGRSYDCATDWAYVMVEFTPSANDPFLVIKICAEGTGTAWFDDLELVEVP